MKERNEEEIRTAQQLFDDFVREPSEAALATAQYIVGLRYERDRYRSEAENRRAFTQRLAAQCRRSNLRLRRFRAAYERCRRQYQVLNALHREAMQQIERRLPQ